jgi:hypothetical protein
LPDLVALSQGHAIAAGAWAVPLYALADLKLVLPANAKGKAQIWVTLVGVDGAVLVEKKSTLVIDPSTAATTPRGGTSGLLLVPASPPETAPAERPGRGAPDAQVAQVAPLPADRERATKLLKEGDQHMAKGNIAAARMVYELAADAGLAQGAMALAATYDPAELARLSVRGIQSDMREARRWYDRARQLGAKDAEQRLQRLGAN